MDKTHWSTPFKEKQKKLLKNNEKHLSLFQSSSIEDSILDILVIKNKNTEIDRIEKFFPAFAQAINEILDNLSAKTNTKIKYLENIFDKLEYIAITSRFDDLKKAKIVTLKNHIDETIKQIDNIIDSSNSNFFKDDEFEPINNDTQKQLVNVKNNLNATRYQIKLVLNYLSTKGPKNKLYLSSEMNSLLALFESLLKKTTKEIKIKSIDNCFNYEAENNESLTKANPIKLTVLALNATGININLNNLRKNIDSFKKTSLRVDQTNTMSDLVHLNKNRKSEQLLIAMLSITKRFYLKRFS